LGPTAAPSGASRTNPAPYGSQVTVNDLTLELLEATRPADPIVAAGSLLNATPEPGKENVRVTVRATCEKAEDETCSIGPALNLELVGSASVAHNPLLLVAGVGDRLEFTEFYGGVTVSGSVLFEVGSDATDLVLRYRNVLATS
jgi:hypothetical protein